VTRTRDEEEGDEDDGDLALTLALCCPLPSMNQPPLSCRRHRHGAPPQAGGDGESDGSVVVGQ
jgi:hypothetical protein